MSAHLCVTIRTTFGFIPLSPRIKLSGCLRVSRQWSKISLGKRLFFFHLDHGGKFTSKEFNEFLAMEGVIWETSAPKTPQQNGVAEWMNQTFLGGARAMLQHSRMSKGFWAEALGTTAHIANWFPCKGLGWQTPFKLLFGRIPDISYFQTFGCHAWKYNAEAKEWDPKVLPMVLISYKTRSKAYHLWDPKSHKIVVSANVWFSELELLYQPTFKPVTPAPAPKPAPCSSQVKLLETAQIPWNFFDEEDPPKPSSSVPCKSPSPTPSDKPSDSNSELDPDDVSLGARAPTISGHMLNTLRIQSISNHNVSSGQRSDTFKMYPVM